MADKEQIQRQLRFLRIDAETVGALRHLEGAFESSIDDILHEFYEHILKEPELAALFKDDDAVAHAQAAQKRHWLDTLFASEFGQAQFDQSERVARAHVEIGLLPSWYLAAYCFLLNHFVELIANHYPNDTASLSRVVQALNKAVFLDINLVIENYLEARDNLMRGILMRATDFAEDVRALNADLVESTRELRAKIESASSASGDGAELRVSSERLAAQVEKLNARVEALQFKDRLYFHKSREDNLMARLRSSWHKLRIPGLGR